MRGTLLNTATVAGGGLLGLAVGRFVPEAAGQAALAGIGLVTLGLGMKMLLGARSFVAVAAGVAIGGVLGTLLGIDAGLRAFAEGIKSLTGGGGKFVEAVVGTSVLFCVGPMTLLGCLEDGLEGKIDLLAVKSLMDGITAFFFAATLGPGVLVTALVVLLIQGGLTLAARRLRGLAENRPLIDDASAAGGALLVAIALSLLDVKSFPTANYLPAVLLAPLGARLLSRFESRGR